MYITLPLLKEEQQKISKQLSAIEYEIKQRNVTFEQITQNLTDALDLLDDCAAFYKNSSDTIKRLLNQAIFEKIYISCEKGSPVKVEAEFNPPFDMLVEPFTDELIKVNRAIRMGPDKTIEKINKAKDRILRNLRCGLSDSENKEPYSEADFFTYKFVSKALLVERTRLEVIRTL